MTTPEIHPHEVEAIRALVNLHDPDTQPAEWHPDHHATAETAAQLLRPLLTRTDADAAYLPEIDRLWEPEPPMTARIVGRWDRRHPGSDIWHRGCVGCARLPGEYHQTDCPRAQPPAPTTRET